MCVLTPIANDVYSPYQGFDCICGSGGGDVGLIDQCDRKCANYKLYMSKKCVVC